MIENGASVNLASKSGRTPLHSAVRRSRFNVVASLIDAGAHVNATDIKLNTPLHSINKPVSPEKCYNSTTDDCYKIAELLIQKGADVNAKNVDGKTPLDLVTNKNSKFSIYLRRTIKIINKIILISLIFFIIICFSKETVKGKNGRNHSEPQIR